MSCDCLEKVTADVARLASDPKKAGAGATAECASVAMCFGTKVSLDLYIPFNVKGPNVGYRSQKGKEIPVFATYCPFCGKKIKEDANAPT